MLTISGSSFADGQLHADHGSATGPTQTQLPFTTTTDNDSVTITFTQGDAANSGAFVGNFSLS